MPRNTQPLYRRGNLIIWDQEGTDLDKGSWRIDEYAALKCWSVLRRCFPGRVR
jgi:hypothetical protein